MSTTKIYIPRDSAALAVGADAASGRQQCGALGGLITVATIRRPRTKPASRYRLRIELTDAVEAEEMFVRLMGDEVEPRRQFIEDNALNVRNLDV